MRTTSLPPSPLSGGLIPGASAGSRRESSDASPVTPGGAKTLRRSKQSSSPNTRNYTNNATPSLLNGTGDSRSISSGPGARGSDGLLSLPSPPQSRSSSAQDSYSTSATTFEEHGEVRGRETSAEAMDDKGLKTSEGKGNVIVSVRVRPEGNDKTGNSGAEWMVDGRRSLVSYKGKEGGDYYYGEFITLSRTAR